MPCAAEASETAQAVLTADLTGTHSQNKVSRLSQPVGCKTAAEPKENPWSAAWLSSAFACQVQAYEGVSLAACTCSLCAPTQ